MVEQVLGLDKGSCSRQNFFGFVSRHGSQALSGCYVAT